jgi:hypothetical protein
VHIVIGADDNYGFLALGRRPDSQGEREVLDIPRGFVENRWPSFRHFVEDQLALRQAEVEKLIPGKRPPPTLPGIPLFPAPTSSPAKKETAKAAAPPAKPATAQKPAAKSAASKPKAAKPAPSKPKAAAKPATKKPAAKSKPAKKVPAKKPASKKKR